MTDGGTTRTHPFPGRVVARVRNQSRVGGSPCGCPLGPPNIPIVFMDDMGCAYRLLRLGIRAVLAAFGATLPSGRVLTKDH